jgi:hypothetical protein
MSMSLERPRRVTMLSAMASLARFKYPPRQANRVWEEFSEGGPRDSPLGEAAGFSQRCGPTNEREQPDLTRQRAHRAGGGGGAVLDTELHKHLLEVFVDRARADVEDFADFAVGFAAADP